MSNQTLERSYSVAQVSPKELYPSVVEAVFDRLQSIANDDELYEPGEPRPSKATIDWALRVLLRVIPRYFLRTAEIDASHGEIHVTWERNNKRVVAFLPSADVLKVYLERIDDNGEVAHTLRPGVQPQDLNPVLKWLFL